MRAITAAIFICLFLLLRPYLIQQGSILYEGDDQSYFAHASALVFGQFPDYKKEFFTLGDQYPGHPMGPGLMASPFVSAFSLVDRWQGSDIVNVRTRANVPLSWSLFGFVFASSFYFWLACFLLYKGLCCRVQPKTAVAAILLMILAQGIPLFVYRRPVFPHVYTLFLQSWFVFFFLKSPAGVFLPQKGWRQPLLVGLLAGLMTLVKYNNVFMALAWPLVLAGFPQGKELRKRWKQILIVYVVWAAMIVLFKILPESINYWAGFDAAKQYLLTWHPVSFYFKRIVHVLFGLDWGLCYTAPFVLIGFVYALVFKSDLKKKLLFLLVPAVFNLYVVIQWMTQGGWYGYRYLLFLMAPLVVYPFADLLEKSIQRWKHQVFFVLIPVALLPILSMLCFDGNNLNLTLKIIDQHFGREGWGNNTYQLEVWKTVFFHPQELAVALLKGGPLYLVFLLSSLFHCQQLLPSIVLERYPNFQWETFIKTGILYALPFVLYALSKRIQGGKR